MTEVGVPTEGKTISGIEQLVGKVGNLVTGKKDFPFELHSNNYTRLVKAINGNHQGKQLLPYVEEYFRNFLPPWKKGINFEEISGFALVTAQLLDKDRVDKKTGFLIRPKVISAVVQALPYLQSSLKVAEGHTKLQILNTLSVVAGTALDYQAEDENGLYGQVAKQALEIVESYNPQLASELGRLGDLKEDQLCIINSLVTEYLYGSVQQSEWVGEVMDDKFREKGWTSFSTLVSSWLVNCGNRRATLISENIRDIFNLDGQRPGITNLLTRAFGIRNFARYPSEILIDQYDTRNQPDQQYGMIVYPTDDKKSLADFSKQLKKGGYTLKVVECSGQLSFVHHLNFLRKYYGKIPFAVIGGHGDADGIQMGKKGEKGAVILLSDLLKDGSSALGLAFDINPTIILNACSTGRLGGIGQSISQKEGSLKENPFLVIGPDGEARTLSFGEINFDENNRPIFSNVSYGRLASPRMYLGGKELTAQPKGRVLMGKSG